MAADDEYDACWIRAAGRPVWSDGLGPVRVADLFCGLGGMSIGLAAAARELGYAVEVALAVESWAVAAACFESNFPGVSVHASPVEELFAGVLGSEVSDVERVVQESVGAIDILVGGPPCQGNSTSNNRSRNEDPRNALYARVARAAEVLRPQAVLIENVPAVVRDRGGCVPVTRRALEAVGFAVDEAAVDLTVVGVPQRRRRHLLLATRIPGVSPSAVLASLRASSGARSVEWAIGDLADEPEGYPAGDPFYGFAGLSPQNVARVGVLFEQDLHDLPDEHRPLCHRDGGHSYKSMYGRLRWSEPAQTLTTGFTSPGQGRYVHPARRRTLTPHEAARLQTLPDWLPAGAAATRTQWARMIGNAVPPFLARAVGRQLIPGLDSCARRGRQSRGAGHRTAHARASGG